MFGLNKIYENDGNKFCFIYTGYKFYNLSNTWVPFFVLPNFHPCFYNLIKTRNTFSISQIITALCYTENSWVWDENPLTIVLLFSAELKRNHSQAIWGANNYANQRIVIYVINHLSAKKRYIYLTRTQNSNSNSWNGQF